VSTKKARISLCMIVKDEESVLGRCLESAKPWVDEIIVVDTGSTDRSMDVARDHGARVFEHPWTDDFSAARNAAIEHATGHWILSLDADEILEKRAGRDLRKVVGKSNFVGAYIPLRDEGDDDKVTVSLMFRFWRNRPEIRWRYRLHEQVLPCAFDLVHREGLRLAQIAGQIVHDGYQADVMAAKGKNERNERLYDLQISDTPDDLYVLYKYADFLRKFEGRSDEALRPLERGYELIQDLSADQRHEYTFTGELCALLGLHLQKIGETTRALEVTTFGIEKCRESAHLWYVHGNSLSYAGRWEEAAESFVKCASFHGRAMHVPPQAHITGIGARKGLIRALTHQGLYAKAADEAWSVVTDYQEDKEAIRLFVDVAALEGDWSKTTNRLIERVKDHPSCGTSWFKGGELFFRMQLFDKALPWILRAAECFEDPGPAYGLAGECLLAAGHYEPAIDHFSRGLPDDVRCRAGILLMSLAYGIESVEQVDPGDEELLAEVRRMVKNLRELGHDRLTRRLHEAGPTLEETDPTAHRFLEAALT
jgi:glycosyltransferase involved in cell wall biosynthesis